MKRFLVALSVTGALMFGSSLYVFAEDGASLYKACQGCHGAQGEKQPMGVGSPIKGQKADEVITKLKGYKDGTYGNEKKAIMVNIIKRFNDDQIKMLADHIAAF